MIKESILQEETTTLNCIHTTELKQMHDLKTDIIKSNR